MRHSSSPAIVLHAIDHGDNDRIVTFFTLRQGKVTLIAKGAKKSIKRFAGVLELFSVLDLVWTDSRRQGLPVLQEATVLHPFEQIRTDVTRTAYASYWCELVYAWTEPRQKQVAVYDLLEHTLARLNSDSVSEKVLHITFQLRFMGINGFGPSFDTCLDCRMPIGRLGRTFIAFDVKRGGILCNKCGQGASGHTSLSMGTINILRWVLTAPLEKTDRVKFSGRAIEESVNMLEPFLGYHLGKETKSLKFLKQLSTRLPY